MTEQELEAYHKKLQKQAEDEYYRSPEYLNYQQIDAKYSSELHNQWRLLTAEGPILLICIIGGISGLVFGTLLIPLFFGGLFLAAVGLHGHYETTVPQLESASLAAKSKADSAHFTIQGKYEAVYQKKADEIHAQQAAKEQAARDAAHKAVLKAKRIQYASSPALPGMSAWLQAFMETAIQKADRQTSQREIVAVLEFTAYFDHLQCAYPVYEKNRDDPAPYCYSFHQHRLDSVFDADDLIALAQALAKAVQFEIMNRYKQDPILPCNNSPIVRITSHDSPMRLVYSVRNPKFIPSQKI